MNDDVRDAMERVLHEVAEIAIDSDDLGTLVRIVNGVEVADAILAALADKGRGLYDINAEVKVDRERFERQRNVTEAAYEWVNSPLGDGVEIERVEKRLVSLVDALQPGDFDPLPKRGE